MSVATWSVRGPPSHTGPSTAVDRTKGESMASRWDVEQAVLQSRLEPTARLIVLVLLTRTSGDTAVIPSEQSPSLTELQSQTGLSWSTLVGWLDVLDVAGWVKRVRPPRHHGRDRTQYALAVGDPVATRGGRREG